MYYQRNKIGITEIIIIINVIVFFVLYLIPKLYFILSLNIGDPADFLNIFRIPIAFSINTHAYWQILTSIFLHGGIFHLIFNMYGLYIFGKPLEEKWGKKNFLFFYLTVGILANIASILFLKLTTSNPIILVGASGSIMGVLIAFGAYYPDVTLLLFFVIPIKVKWAIALYALVELFLEISSGATSKIAHFTHLFGFLFGFLYLLMFFKMNAIKEMFFSKRNYYYY